MTDNLIQVGAVFDGAQLKIGAEEAAAGVQKSLAKMQVAFDELKAATSARIAEIEAKLAELEAAHHKHLGGAHQAVGGLKLAFEDAGIGINRHVGHWLATLPGLGSVFAAAFPVVAIISFADSFVKSAEKMAKHNEEMNKVIEEAARGTDAISKFGEQLHISNLRLEDEIATLQKRPKSNGLALALAEARSEADQLTEAIQKAIDADNKLLEGMAQNSLTKLMGTGDIQKLINETSEGVAKIREEMAEAKVKISIDTAEHNEKDLAADRKLYQDKLKEYAQFLSDQQLALNAVKARIRAQLTAESPGEDGTMLPGLADAKALKYVDDQTKDLQRSLNILRATAMSAADGFQEIKKHAVLIDAKEIAENQRKISDLLSKAGQEIRRMAEKAAKDQQEASARATQEIIRDAHTQNVEMLKSNMLQREAWDELYKGQIETAKQASLEKIQLIEQDFERGKITQQKEIALIARTKQEELAQEVRFHQLRIALWAGDLKKIQEIENQIAKAQQQSVLVGTKATTDGLKAQQQQYGALFSQITGGMASEVKGWLQGTQSMAQAGQKMYQDLVFSMFDYFEKKAVKKLEDWALEQLFGKKKAADNVAQATSNTAVAATEALASVPWPFNIAAATETESMGMGFVAQAGVAFFEKGTNFVPQDGLAFLHRGEEVIPASKSGTGWEGDRGSHFHLHFNVSAIDADGVATHLQRNKKLYSDLFFKEAKRKGFGK